MRPWALFNQHRRFVFSVGALLAPPGAPNELRVAFPPTVSDARNDNGRFMGASGGWVRAKRKLRARTCARARPFFTPNPKRRRTAHALADTGLGRVQQ